MKSKFRRKIEQFFEKKNVSRFDRLAVEVSTEEEAEELCLLMKENIHQPKHCAHLLLMFQPEDASEEAIEILRTKGTAVLLELEPKLEPKNEGLTDARLFLLKLLAMYGTAEGADRIISVARAGYAQDGYLWSVIFGCFTRRHPASERVFAELSTCLPGGFAAVSLLDAANHCAIDGMQFQHPFDSPAGTDMLRGWLRDTDPERSSYAHSATATLPFISNLTRAELLQLAMDHFDPDVSVEAAWAAGKVGMERGISELARFAKQVNTAAKAIHLLGELGREDAIPAEAQDPDFQAMAEMVQWLSHPNEFGEPPTRISLYDSRELFWPPTNDRRRVWLFRYEYPKSEQRDEEQIGLGMVGSTTFALFGETTTDLSPMEAYALHCCWELEQAEDPRAPSERSVAAGLEILGEHNDLPPAPITVAPREDSARSPEDSPASPADNPEPEDNLSKLMAEMLKTAKEKKASGKTSGKKALVAAVTEMMDAQVSNIQFEAEQLRTHLVAQRRAAPALRISTRTASRDILEGSDVARQRAALESAGYALEGVFEFQSISGFSLVLLRHAGNGTLATISCGKTLTTELAAAYPDGRGFYVRDTPAARGIPSPPWVTYRYEPGSTVAELITIFESTRPAGHLIKSGPQAVADIATDYNRIQSWRVGRGGWTREEVQAQLGIADAKGAEDKITEACLSVREKWLFAWFNENHPELAEEFIETLIIIHDEQDSYLLFMLWVMGGASVHVRRSDFENASPREAFQKVNESNGRPLTLIATKTDGYPACFYRPTRTDE